MRSDPRSAATGVAVLVALVAAAPAIAENVDPGAIGAKYVWSENAGWINAQPSGPGGPGMQVDEFDLTGWLWAENLGWVSLSCANTGSCVTVDYGVTNSGGTLAGYAWAENAGWISFSCSNTGSCGSAVYGVTINPATGVFDGRAWAENVGWISFRSVGPNPFELVTGWTCSVPAASPSLAADKGAGFTALLSWAPVPGATAFDVVRGDLDALRGSGGNFGAATLDCVEDNTPATNANHAGAPPSGETWWYLARAADCGGGTYDSTGVWQAAPRDAGIVTSGAACP